MTIPVHHADLSKPVANCMPYMVIQIPVLDNSITENNNISNATLSRKHRRLVSDSDWHAVRFLTNITDIRNGVNSMQFNGSLFVITWFK